MSTSLPSARRERRGNGGWAFPDLVVETWGDLACFTRPELKVERVSYPVMTPSAATGLLESIFWKPQFNYAITKIEVLAPIRWMQVRRNEVQSGISDQRVAQLRTDRTARYDASEDRDQRNTVALRDVRYRIHAQVVTISQEESPEEKYRQQLRKRVERGACFSQPFFGCREFTAQFGPADPAYEVQRDCTQELGLMLHSIAYTPQGERYRWFRASVSEGVMEVPLAPLPDEAVAMPSGSQRAARAGR
ncbi:type I-C CRISPR-associated protein Cas5c [Streptomyces sp. NPDC021020]|uniref:type I-C CRISPR-associated protein Cas5c n=1 Tax=Streptomyces sp. NPDC021020 TaxID=3365109 RepID=UPI0037AD44CF